VTDRLGAMENGLQKAAIAQQLMGRGGQALIPTLNALAGDGFDKVTEAAKRSGQYLTDDMAADAAAAAASFAELEGAGKGIATQFEAGLLPALTDVADALTSQVEEGGVSSFRTLGEEAGTVVKTLVLAWQIGANTIGAILLTLYDIVSGQFKQLGNAVEMLGEAAIDAAHGHFSDAGKAIATGFHTGVTLAKGEVDDLKSRWTSLADVVTKSSAALFPSDPGARQKAREDKFKGKGDGSDDDPTANDSKANKARLSLEEARLQEELALHKAQNAQEESANQIAYDEGLEGLKQYFAKKKALAQNEVDEQIRILTAERAAVAASAGDGTDAAEIAKKQKLAKIDSDIAIAKVQSTTKQGQLDQQQFKDAEAHEKTLLDYQATILAAQGLTYAAAIQRIKGEEAQVAISLAQSGLSKAEVAAMVQQLQSLKLATAAFDEDKKQSEVALKSLATEKDEINLKAQQGLITQIGAEQQIAQLELSRLPALYAIAAAMKAAAITPAQVQEAADFKRQLDQIAASANTAGKQMATFKNSAVQAIGGDLANFLGSTINNVNGVGDAFRQLAGTVVASIQQIVAQLIVQIAMEKLLKSITSSQDDGSGGGGGGSGSGGIVGSLLGLLGMAEGGFVSGPGSGTSDSIPARLSAGEFVVQAAAVRAVGLDTLSMINRGIRIPSISGMSIPRFAEGGLVQEAGGSSGMDLRLALGLDEGLILKHLESKAAGRIVLQHLATNPKAATRALQRGQ
jgi:hypothetical protein